MDGLTTLRTAPSLGDRLHEAYGWVKLAEARALRWEGIDRRDASFVVYSAENPHVAELNARTAAFQALNTRWAEGER